jgi:4-amino-4-deoxy-L-arabinose transferase-like glycosyltransferase
MGALMTRSVSARTRVVWLLAIVVVAFAIRLVATVQFEGLSSGPNSGAFYDGVEFEQIAANLVRHGEFSVHAGRPTSFRAPGFPIALAAVYAVFGIGNFVAAHVVFCLIGAAACLAAFLVAREIAGDVAGLITAALVAVYPNLLYYAMHFSSEPLFTLLLVLSVWSFIRAMRGERLSYYVASGALLGLSALTRPAAFYFLPFFALVALLGGRRLWLARSAGIAVMVIGLMLPIAPWAARNYRVHGRHVLLASNGGSTFWGANNAIVLADPKYHGDWITTEAMPDQKKLVHALPNEVDRDRLEWELGKQFVRQHPAAIPRLSWYKLYWLWTPESRTPNVTFNRIHVVSYGLMLPLMIAGLVMLVRRRGLRDEALMAVVAPVVATTAATIVFYGSARFRSTIEPFLLVFAAVAIAVIASRLSARFNAFEGPR